MRLCSERWGGARQAGGSLRRSSVTSCSEGAFANLASALCSVKGLMLFGDDVRELRVGLMLVIKMIIPDL